MKYVIGWLRTKPGRRDEFMRLSKPVFEITRKEVGCLFYEAHPAADDIDLIVFIEGWETSAHHHAHEKAPHHVAFGPEVVRLCTGGVFEEIEAKNAVTKRPQFS